jgi:hypothetical protein
MYIIGQARKGEFQRVPVCCFNWKKYFITLSTTRPCNSKSRMYLGIPPPPLHGLLLCLLLLYCQFGGKPRRRAPKRQGNLLCMRIYFALLQGRESGQYGDLWAEQVCSRIFSRQWVMGHDFAVSSTWRSWAHAFAAPLPSILTWSCSTGPSWWGAFSSRAKPNRSRFCNQVNRATAKKKRIIRDYC